LIHHVNETRALAPTSLCCSLDVQGAFSSVESLTLGDPGDANALKLPRPVLVYNSAEVTQSNVTWITSAGSTIRNSRLFEDVYLKYVSPGRHIRLSTSWRHS
jgi:hypothetical protein